MIIIGSWGYHYRRNITSNHSNGTSNNHGSNDDDAKLPTYHIFDAGNEESITSYADKLILRLEGKDNTYDQTKKKGSYSDNNNQAKKRMPEPEPDDDVFDYDDTDHDYHYDDEK